MKEFVGMKKLTVFSFSVFTFVILAFLLGSATGHVYAKEFEPTEQILIYCPAESGSSEIPIIGPLVDAFNRWRDLATEIREMDITRLVTSAVVALNTETISYITVGKTPELFTVCTAAQMIRDGKACTTDTCAEGTIRVSASCGMDDTAYVNNCGDLDPEAAPVGYINDPRDIRFFNNGFLGFANIVQNVVDSYETPVNLAFYFNKQTEKIPFVGTALAQGSSYKLQPVLDVVYRIWSVVKDISLGIMAVIVLVIGIMIITRRQISPQSVVTIQTALPRIIISIILIVFSYPIGAVLSSLSLGLTVSASDLITRTGISTPGLSITYLMRILVTVAISVVSGQGFVFLVFGIIAMLIILIAMVFMYIKIISTYVQMLILIIMAPFSFALGAVPSYEKQSVKWFKTILAKVLSIPAMKTVFGLAILMSWEIFKVIVGFTGPDANPFTEFPDMFFGATTTVLGLPMLACSMSIIVLLGGLLYARKIPTKIEDLIMGEDAPSKKRK